MTELRSDSEVIVLCCMLGHEKDWQVMTLRYLLLLAFVVMFSVNIVVSIGTCCLQIQKYLRKLRYFSAVRLIESTFSPQLIRGIR